MVKEEPALLGGGGKLTNEQKALRETCNGVDELPSWEGDRFRIPELNVRPGSSGSFKQRSKTSWEGMAVVPSCLEEAGAQFCCRTFSSHVV